MRYHQQLCFRRSSFSISISSFAFDNFAVLWLKFSYKNLFIYFYERNNGARKDKRKKMKRVEN